jgi:ligand-binding SRPBCC domain-containing protein
VERITPPFLQIRIVTPKPIVMAEGASIDYRLLLHGARFNWRTMIESWSPDEEFVDTQLSGPHALWCHMQ